MCRKSSLLKCNRLENVTDCVEFNIHWKKKKKKSLASILLAKIRPLLELIQRKNEWRRKGGLCDRRVWLHSLLANQILASKSLHCQGHCS